MLWLLHELVDDAGSLAAGELCDPDELHAGHTGIFERRYTTRLGLSSLLQSNASSGARPRIKQSRIHALQGRSIHRTCRLS